MTKVTISQFDRDHCQPCEGGQVCVPDRALHDEGERAARGRRQGGRETREGWRSRQGNSILFSLFSILFYSLFYCKDPVQHSHDFFVISSCKVKAKFKERLDVARSKGQRDPRIDIASVVSG